MTEQRVFLVSPPRSGHHMLVQFLNEIFDPLSYCEYYSCPSKNGSPCKAKDWPLDRKVGCVSGRRVQKNHDFDLTLPIRDEYRYVVVVREPLYSLTSWHAHRTRVAPPGTIIDAIPQFIWRKASYWSDFGRKWADGLEQNNVLLTSYSRLTSSHLETHRVATFVNGDVPPPGLAKFSAETFPGRLTKPRDLRSEDIFDARLYDRVQRKIGHELIRRCGLEVMDFGVPRRSFFAKLLP